MKRPQTKAEKDAYKKLAEAAAELQQATEDADILARLPKTADGIRVGPCDDMWWPNLHCPRSPVLHRFELCYGMGGGDCTVAECYSTKEAAIAAATGGAV